MLKRILAALLCGVTAAAVFASCGKEIELADGSSASESIDAADAEVMNFTAPQNGDTVIEMKIRNYGIVKIRLFPEYADKGVENFVELAKQGYYDGLTFHRVIKDFMIQGGDPLGTGTGGQSIWGEKFDGGSDPRLINCAGALVYANSGSTATDGSQFYIVTGTVYSEADLDSMGISENYKKVYSTAGGAPWLDGSYTVFGQVYDGLDVIFNAQHVETDSSDKPIDSLIIDYVKVTEYNGEELRWYITDYDYQAPTLAPVENVDIKNFTAPEEGETIVTLTIKDYGDVKIKLFPEFAEKGVENFIELAKSGYYDGLSFHRVVKDFMLWGGDPNGDGTGGESAWGGSFDGGTDPHLIHVAGAVAYATLTTPAENGSQFFIVTGEKYSDEDFDNLESYGYRLSDNAKAQYSSVGGDPTFDGNYTIFGQIFDGLDVIFKAQEIETDEYGTPTEQLIIESVTVDEYDGSQPRWYITDYDLAEAEVSAEDENIESAE